MHIITERFMKSLMGFLSLLKENFPHGVAHCTSTSTSKPGELKTSAFSEKIGFQGKSAIF